MQTKNSYFLYLTPLRELMLSRTFWFSLSIVFSILYSILFLQIAFGSEYSIQDDARRSIVWMMRFSDSELFPDDFLMNYYQWATPSALASLYKLMSMVGINAILFNKLVPIALGLISTIYCYRVSLQILPVPLAGFISTLFLNQNLWLKDDLGSGTPRGFLYPLFLAFIYYLLRSSTIPCLLSLILLAFFYPPSVLVASGVLVLRLFSWNNQRLRLTTDRKEIVFCIVSLLVVFLILLTYLFKSSDYGAMVSLAEARNLSEFGQDGKIGFFHREPLTFWTCNDYSGFFPRDWCIFNPFKRKFFLLPPQILLGLALPIILYYRSHFSLVERITSARFILPQILLSSIAFYLISHAVLFKLYLPQRYTEHSLRIVFAIAGGIALSMLIDKLLEWGGKKTIASGITIIIFLLLQVAMIYSYLPILYFNRTRSLLLTGLMVIQILGLVYFVGRDRKKTLPAREVCLSRVFLTYIMLIVIAVSALLYPLSLKKYYFFPKVSYITGKEPELYQFLAKQPKDSLVASLSLEGDNIPSFALRPVFVHRDSLEPYNLLFYEKLRQRYIDLIEAQYSPDLTAVQNFIQKNNIRFWLLDRSAFSPDYPIDKVGLQSFGSVTSDAVERLQAGTPLVLSQLSKSCSVVESKNIILLDASCILDAKNPVR